MPSRDKRPSKYSQPSTASRADSGGESSGAVRAIKRTVPPNDPSGGSGAIALGEPREELVGFEDARPGWARFLAGLGGVQGPDIAGLNAQVAINQQRTTAQQLLQEAEAVQREKLALAEHNYRLKAQEAQNALELGRIERAHALSKELASDKAQMDQLQEQMRFTNAIYEDNNKSANVIEQDRLRSKNTQREQRQRSLQEATTKMGFVPTREGQSAADKLARTRGSIDQTVAERLQNDKEYLNARRVSEVALGYAPHVKNLESLNKKLSKGEALINPGIRGSNLYPGTTVTVTPKLGPPGLGGLPQDTGELNVNTTVAPTPDDLAAENAAAARVKAEVASPEAVQAPLAEQKPSTAVVAPAAAAFPTVEDVGLAGVGEEMFKRTGNLGFNANNPLMPVAPNSPINPINMLSGIIPGTDANRAAAEYIYKLWRGKNAQNTNSTSMPAVIRLP